MSKGCVIQLMHTACYWQMEKLWTGILAQQTIAKGFLISKKSEFKSNNKKKRTGEEGKDKLRRLSQFPTKCTKNIEACLHPNVARSWVPKYRSTCRTDTTKASLLNTITIRHILPMLHRNGINTLLWIRDSYFVPFGQIKEHVECLWVAGSLPLRLNPVKVYWQLRSAVTLLAWWINLCSCIPLKWNNCAVWPRYPEESHVLGKFLKTLG